MPLSRWILHGELQDGHNEFFVGWKRGVHETAIWSDAYFLRQGMIPSFLSLELARKIFMIGRTINFIKHCEAKSASYKGQQPLLVTNAGENSSPRSSQHHALVMKSRKNAKGMPRPSVAWALHGDGDDGDSERLMNTSSAISSWTTS